MRLFKTLAIPIVFWIYLSGSYCDILIELNCLIYFGVILKISLLTFQMALAATVNSASPPCIPIAFTSTTCRRWSRMIWCAGWGKKDYLLCFISKKPRHWKVQELFLLLFHINLRLRHWIHRKRNKDDKSKSDFNACTVRSPSANPRIFGIISELTPAIGPFAVSFATRRSHNTRTWERTHAFIQVKNHLSVTTVTKASLRLSRFAVTQELTPETDHTTVSDAVNRLPVFPVWKDITESTQNWNRRN